MIKYLYELPECKAYVNELRRKGFEAYLKEIRKSWLDDMTASMEDYYKAYPEFVELWERLTQYVIDEHIFNRFDEFWDLCNAVISDDRITSWIKMSFRCNRHVKGFVLSEIIPKPVSEYQDYPLWIEWTSNWLRNNEMKINISPSFMKDKLSEYNLLNCSN
jgi:hypothetical protein